VTEAGFGVTDAFPTVSGGRTKFAISYAGSDAVTYFSVR
jgi:hypothetical protein